MSAEFSNAYQEILLDNLMSIIKQNFVFQTQLKLAEENNKKTAEIQAKYEELARAKSNVNETAHEEKTRLQIALNDSMKKKMELEKELNEKKLEIDKLKEYVTKLEEIAPSSKLKKLNLEKKTEEVSADEPAPNDLFKLKANDGSTF